ncbi:MAG: glycosyltransferase family 4 protein [Anaerolineae bacterium]|nr:glycosyltransferase family 4 protein [Thermoflexus sp.]MDW8064575.1 glycosyltransferase family 4 protein [Anaerolineae bacterium]
MKRIILISSSYPLSPEETFNAGVLAREVALGLKDQGHAVWVITPRKDRPICDPQIPVLEFPWLGQDRELATQPVHILNLFRFTSLLLSGALHTKRLAHAIRADICFALWAIPSGALAYWAWRQCGIPYGVWVLGSDIWKRNQYPMGERLVCRVLFHAAFRIADGWGLAQEASRIGGKPCGFLPSLRRLPLETPPAILPPAKWRLVYVGRFEPQKGIDMLVEALCHLRREISGGQIYLLGDGSLRGWVESRIASCDLGETVHILGYASPYQVVAMMKAVDYLIIPSRLESIPLVFGDAIQCELPVIATDVGDLGMLVRKSQVGWVVDELSVGGLVRGLRHALSSLEQRAFFRSNIQRLQKWFHYDRMIDNISGLLNGARNEGELSKGLLEELGEL